MRRMKTGLWVIIAVLLGSMLGPSAADAQKKSLVVALNQDPDLLDPTLSRTYVGRIVFTRHVREALRDRRGPAASSPSSPPSMPQVSDAGKTVTIKLRSGVKFNDGTPMTAEAMKFSLDRHRTLSGSNRKQRAGVGDRGRGGRPAHRAPAPQGAVRAADRAARRPRGHAGVPGRGQEARREVRDRAGLRGPVAVRRAGAPGPDRARALAALLRPRGGEVRPPRLPHHSRRQRAPGESEVR